MEENIDRDNLRLLLHYSRKLSIFQKRATLVQECLDELLANGTLREKAMLRGGR